jgi:pyruvate kinase
MKPKKRTKIVCTIGPASSDKETLKMMVKEGMNVARLNFSHGSHEDHAKLIKTIRDLAEETGEPIAILQDLQGPKIRVGKLPEEGIMLEPGEEIVFSTEPEVELPKISLTYDNLHEDVKAGDKLLLDDGLLDVTVKEVNGRDIICEVVTGGKLTSNKGLNLPTATLSIPAITEKDKEDLDFGISQGVDWVALSFVRSAKEVYDLKYMIKSLEKKYGHGKHHYGPHARIVCKIEKHEAVRDIDEIIEATDGIMVARGDLGIEMPAEEVPLIQKKIIDKCLEKARPVIVATQMLDSMIRNPRPTRAEVSDVANAVIDHTDAVMLSGESASGKYPVESVATMARIISQTEASAYDNLPVNREFETKDTEKAISQVANILAKSVGSRLILAASLSGDIGRIVSRYRPELPVVVAVAEERVRRQLNLSWGVIPFVLPQCEMVEELVDRSVGYLKSEKIVKEGDSLIVVAGEPVGISGGANLLEIRTVK